MAAMGGLKPFEVDFMTPSDVWIVIDAHAEREQKEWERARAIAFSAARFGGNSDPKKFPKTPQKYWPLPWDKKTKIDAQSIMEQHRVKEARLKLLLEKNKLNGSS